MMKKPTQTIIVVGENAEEAATWLRALLAEQADSDVTVTTELPLGDPVRAAFQAQFEAMSRAAEAQWEASMQRMDALEEQERDTGEQS